jgi:hypothetical protein
MTVQSNPTPSIQGMAFRTITQAVLVHDGRRGAVGPDGPAGDQGDTGQSINMRGVWVGGLVYGPEDAVTWRSSAVQGISSLYVQNADQPASVSSTPPQDDPGRWSEVGVYDLNNVTGAICNVTQASHGFTKIGTPIAMSSLSGEWQKADNRVSNATPVAVVREVVDADNFIAQTNGEVTNIDPSIITIGGDWELGRLYYIAAQAGMVQPFEPTDTSTNSQPILIPSRENGSSVSGVALPWRPIDLAQPRYALTGVTQFYFDAALNQTVFSGPDLNGNRLEYQVGPNTDVFVNGLNLSALDQFTATDGISITLVQPSAAGDRIEIVTPISPVLVLGQSTAEKVDNIEASFDGSQTTFPITVNGGAAILVSRATNMMVWIDGNPQEGGADYDVHFNQTGDGTDIVFLDAPEAGARFWGVAYAPVGQFDGATDHGSLSGLGDDDHPQYLTQGRGDARYYTIPEVNALVKTNPDAITVLTARVVALEDLMPAKADAQWTADNFVRPAYMRAEDSTAPYLGPNIIEQEWQDISWLNSLPITPRCITL